MKVDSHNNYDYIESNEILKKYPMEKRFTLAILQDVQKKYGFIPRETMTYIAEYLSLPVSDIYSMATFYKALSLKPKGKYIIKICNGTACHIRGSNVLIEAVTEELNIRPGETTDDGLFSIEIVNCLGACALAPVMVIDDKYYGGMTKEKVKLVIKEYKEAVINE
ncbi:MAG: NADH-quinone oxidoreductase subunit NuoE [Sedimentibacter sp.]|uniref:NADH-quinone oxidoreductase subunit NuoE n=1 Tax=Sedimentibacter sp. TaxID=1960295 RepID=UPI002980F224|nr:NADH-quinone oxidoreductase subunit NuoE [Sedimentibacter sp.]MDW5299682.1 NADH-quinone oxidoreductase subunit NuoE [Sedimentibacter sp.]